MPDHPQNTVTVEFSGSQWWVIVLENGKKLEQTVDLQEHAESYAAGQRARLGLEGEGI